MSFDLVTITAQPAAAGGATTNVLLTETFPGANGAPFPTGWTVTAAGGASTAQATQQSGRGRMVLPGTTGYPGIGATRRDINLADFEISFEVHGTFDTTSGATAEHYREIHARVPAAADPAAGVGTGVYLSLYPSASDPATGYWHTWMGRRRNGVNFELGDARLLPAATRSMKGRYRVQGNRHQVRVWDAAQAEPTSWNLDVVDTTAEAVTAPGAVSLVAVGSSTANSGVQVEWDNVVVTSTVAPPVINTIGAPAESVWNDAFALTADVSGATSLQWSVVSGPRSAEGTFSSPTAANTLFTPATAGGEYVIRLTATNSSSSVSRDVQVAVYAQLWKRTAAGKVPVRIDVNKGAAPQQPVSQTVWRGINLGGAEFGLSASQMPGIHGQDYLWPSQADFDYLASRGVKAVRLPFRWERMQRTLGGALDATELGRLRSALSAALSAGIKIMPEPHNFAEYLVAPSTTHVLGGGVLTKTHLADFWSRMATELKGHPALLGYGLMNEPRGMAAGTFASPAKQWEDASRVAGQAIRATGAVEPIYVPGYNYSGAQVWTTEHTTGPWMTGVSAVVYEAHYYMDRNNSGSYANSYAAENTDAVSRGYASIAARAQAELGVFLDWCATHNVRGALGEIGWPNSADSASWNALAETLYDQLDVAGMQAFAWAAAQWFGLTYPLSVYTGVDVNSPLSRATNVAAIVEAHPTVGGVNPSLVRGKTITATGVATGAASTLTDGDSSNTEIRSAGYPLTVGMDTGAARTTVAVGHLTPNYVGDSDVTAGATYNEIGAFTWASSPDNTTWTNRQTVTGNTRRARTAKLELGGHRYIRFQATAGNPKNDAQNVDAILRLLEVTSTPLDVWLIHGDSIATAGAMAHRNVAGRVSALDGTRVPIVEPVGWPGLGIEHIAQAGAPRTAWLAVLDSTAARHCLLPIGSNNNQMDPAVFEQHLRTACNDLLSRGIMPVLMTIPWSPDTSRRNGYQAINARIVAVAQANPTLMRLGADRYAFYAANPALISSDQLHPTDPVGYDAEAQLYAQTIAGIAPIGAPTGSSAV